MPTLGVMAATWALACVLTLIGGDLPNASAALVVLLVAGVVFGVGECLHAVVMGPIVSDLAPPQLVGRYFSLLSLSFTAGLAIGPAVGGALLGASPAVLWLSMAAAVAAAGLVVVRLERHVPEHARRGAATPSPVGETGEAAPAEAS